MIHNPYPRDSERHPIQFYVGKDDWRFFQNATGNSRGLAANIAAQCFSRLVTTMRNQNLITYEADTNDRLKNILQRVFL